MPIGGPGPESGQIWPPGPGISRNWDPPQARWSESGVSGPGPGESGQIPWFRGVGNDDFNRPKKVFKLGGKSDPQTPEKSVEMGGQKVRKTAEKSGNRNYSILNHFKFGKVAKSGKKLVKTAHCIGGVTGAKSQEETPQ